MSPTPSIPNPLPSSKDPPPPSRPPSAPSRMTSFDPNPYVLNTSSPSLESHLQSPSSYSNTHLAPSSSSVSNTITHGHDHKDVTVVQREEPHETREFTPFFTLIHDLDGEDAGNTAGGIGLGVTGTAGTGGGIGETGNTYHPTNVHYIFEDDDGSEALTAALMRVARASNSNSTSGGKEKYQERGDDGEDQDDERERREQGEEDDERNSPTTTSTSSSSVSGTVPSRRDHPQVQQGHPPRKPKKETATEAQRQERIIILDISPDLSQITKISSLSPDWQVLSANILHAPSFDNNNNNESMNSHAQNPATATTKATSKKENNQTGLMLNIKGIGRDVFRDSSSLSASSSSQSRHRAEGGGQGEGEKTGDSTSSDRAGAGKGIVSEEEMNHLMERFDRKMAVLRAIVGANSGNNNDDDNSGSGMREGEGEGHGDVRGVDGGGIGGGRE